MRKNAIANHRLPPHNLDAEQCILGAILVDNDAMPLVLESMTGEDFYRSAHQKIFENMVRLYQTNEPIDLITLTNRLNRNGGVQSVGGAAYLASLVDVPLTLGNVEHYVRILKDKSVLRALISATAGAMNNCYEDVLESDEILGQAEEAIFRISDSRMKTAAVPISEVLQNNIEVIEEQFNRGGFVNGLSSGFKDLDNLTTGFKPQELIIIAGRPGMGKTAFALNIASHIASTKAAPVLVFSLEMSKQQLGIRLLCAEARVDSQTLRKGFLIQKQVEELVETKEKLGNIPIFIDDTRTISVLEMRAKARRIKMEHGLGLVILDYLQLMQGRKGAESREIAVAEISRGLRALAQEMEVPVVALSQLNRELMKREDKRPRLSDLRESGSIEQDADLVIFIHREDAFKNKKNRVPDGVAEIIIAKQRNGPIDTIKLAFLKEYTRFEDLSYVMV
jgi:replicative DNA helicase